MKPRTLVKAFLLLIFWQLWAFTGVSVARLVHEIHFYVSAALRQSSYLNHTINHAIHRLWRVLDTQGTEDVAFTLQPTRFQHLNAERAYLRLAEESIAAMDQLYSVQSHRIFYHGIGDAWAFWVVLILRCSVQNCTDPATPYALESGSPRNMLAWRGLSGSDDVLWACLALSPFPQFLDMPYHWNGARGARQLYSEAEAHYVTHTGNGTVLYWDTTQRYTATISLTLWIAASVRLYERTGEGRYLANALSGFQSLVDAEGWDSPLVTAQGFVYDGRWGDTRRVKRDEWTYNSGVALAALIALYRTTRRDRYLLMAEAVARHAILVFWEGSGYLYELPHLIDGRLFMGLNTDQFWFKGIFLHYLGEFLAAFREAEHGRPTPKWIYRLQSLVRSTATLLVHQRLTDRGFCVYWGEFYAEHVQCKDNRSYHPSGMTGASQLFMLAHKLHNSS